MNQTLIHQAVKTTKTFSSKKIVYRQGHPESHGNKMKLHLAKNRIAFSFSEFEMLMQQHFACDLKYSNKTKQIKWNLLMQYKFSKMYFCVLSRSPSQITYLSQNKMFVITNSLISCKSITLYFTWRCWNSIEFCSRIILCFRKILLLVALCASGTSFNAPIKTAYVNILTMKIRDIRTIIEPRYILFVLCV